MIIQQLLGSNGLVYYIEGENENVNVLWVGRVFYSFLEAVEEKVKEGVFSKDISRSMLQKIIREHKFQIEEQRKRERYHWEGEAAFAVVVPGTDSRSGGPDGYG